MLERGPDFWHWFDKIPFSYHCVHPIQAKMFSIQMLQRIFQSNLPRFCTLVLFIIIINSTIAYIILYIIILTVQNIMLFGLSVVLLCLHVIIKYPIVYIIIILLLIMTIIIVYSIYIIIIVFHDASFQIVNQCYNNYTM